MNARTRIGLLLALVVVLVVGFVVLKPADDNGNDKTADNSSTTTPAKKQTDTNPTATARSAPEPPITQLKLRDHAIVGGVGQVEVRKGDEIRVDVTSNVPDKVHMHGYDIEKDVTPGQTTRFRVKATLEGQFDIESHEAEEQGKEPLLAKLVVRPSS